MAHALPLTKLAGLLIKTLSKPLSKQIKHQASRHPLGQRLLIGIGQSIHSITSRMTIWSAGYKVRSIKAIEEEQALKEGAEFVGESVVFLVSGTWVLYEYNSAQAKNKAKDEGRRAAAAAEREELRTQLHAIDVRLVALESALQKQWGISYQAPPEKHKVQIAPKQGEKVIVTAAGDNKEKKAESSDTSPPSEQSTESNRPWWKWIWPL